MKIYEYPSKIAEKRINSIINRGLEFSKKELQNVSRILEDVKQNGDEALIKYTNRFDSSAVKIDSLVVSTAEFEKAESLVDKTFIDSLDIAISRIENFHKRQLENSWIDTNRRGIVLGRIVNPVEKAGIYVPGGKGGITPLVSSVLMGVIPAKIAGVKTILIVTPPTKQGFVNPYLLVAAKKVGVDAVFKIGSAWAIGALTYGTKTVPKVDVIAGPGNLYVTLAKKSVSGIVGIDMIAGPSELLIIADKFANYEFVAADLLSQAEHDPQASSILITDSKKIAEEVDKSLAKQLEKLSRKEIAKSSIESFGAIIMVKDVDIAIALSNLIAPEHLELLIKEPFEQIGKIKNAGAVFMGQYSPEPVGDYIAGPNHVLPTAGTARFASALSVEYFTKKTSLISYSKKALNKEADSIIRLAEIEGLDAHANAIKMRLE